jgi:antitoxin CcdA
MLKTPRCECETMLSLFLFSHVKKQFIVCLARTTFISYFHILLVGEKLTTQSVTVSTKVPKQLKEKIQRLKIKPSKILRKALEEEVKKREIEELKEEIKKIQPILDKISTQDTVKSIREDRDSR